MVQKAESGHPGLPLDAAPMAYALWTKQLKHHPANPHWADRDRFVLSAGHGSALLYSLLHMTGYDLSLDDIKHFRQWGSKTPGHPERGDMPGVEVTTGPLGQGLANAVGMAIGEAHLAARYNRDGHTVIDHHTWAIVSDGDLMEGVASEAASLAGHLKLGKLICLYDDNYVSLAAGTDITFSEDRAKRFEAYGWQTIKVADGNDVDGDRRKALDEARAETGKPTLILVRTHTRVRLARAGFVQGARLAAGRRGREEDQAETGLAGGTGLPGAGRGARRISARRRIAGAKAEQAWDERMDGLCQGVSGPGAGTARSPRAASSPTAGTRDIPAFPADAKGIVHPRGRRQGDECVRAESCRACSAARPISIRPPSPT